MRAILIDTPNQTITEVEHNGDYRQIYKLLDIGTFTVMELNDKGETLYIDDEGVLKEDKHDYFMLVGPDYAYPQPLAGKALILGTSRAGNSISTKLALDKVRANVRFAKLSVVGWTPPREYETDDPVFGKTTVFDAGRPIFEPYEGEDA